MDIFIAFLVLLGIPAIIAAVAAYIIYLITRNKLRKAGNPRTKQISILTLVGSYIIILAAILILLFYNLRFER